MNASRAKRAMMTHYQTFYEERAKTLDSIIDKYKQRSTFEEFVGAVYSPNGGGSCLIGGDSVVSVSRSDLSSVSRDQTRDNDTWHSDSEPRQRAMTGLEQDYTQNFKQGNNLFSICQMIDLI